MKSPSNLPYNPNQSTSRLLLVCLPWLKCYNSLQYSAVTANIFTAEAHVLSCWSTSASRTGSPLRTLNHRQSTIKKSQTFLSAKGIY